MIYSVALYIFFNTTVALYIVCVSSDFIILVHDFFIYEFYLIDFLTFLNYFQPLSICSFPNANMLFLFSHFFSCRLTLNLLDLQVAIFIVLAMVLRRKPDSLIAVLPTLRENTKYQGQDKLPVIVWMIAQVRGRCQNNYKNL